MSNLDANVNNQIFRKDFAIIIALNRQLATIQPVRIANDSTDMLAGTVLGRRTSDGIYKRYNSGNSDGSQTAACVMFEDVLQDDFNAQAPALTGFALTRGIFAGYVFQAKLTGLDAGAITNLGGRTIIDASGVSILKF